MSKRQELLDRAKEAKTVWLEDVFTIRLLEDSENFEPANALVVIYDHIGQRRTFFYALVLPKVWGQRVSYDPRVINRLLGEWVEEQGFTVRGETVEAHCNPWNGLHLKNIETFLSKKLEYISVGCGVTISMQHGMRIMRGPVEFRTAVLAIDLLRIVELQKRGFAYHSFVHFLQKHEKDIIGVPMPQQMSLYEVVLNEAHFADVPLFIESEAGRTVYRLNHRYVIIEHGDTLTLRMKGTNAADRHYPNNPDAFAGFQQKLRAILEGSVRYTVSESIESETVDQVMLNVERMAQDLGLTCYSDQNMFMVRGQFRGVEIEGVIRSCIDSKQNRFVVWELTGAGVHYRAEWRQGTIRDFLCKVAESLGVNNVRVI